MPALLRSVNVGTVDAVPTDSGGVAAVPTEAVDAAADANVGTSHGVVTSIGRPDGSVPPETRTAKLSLPPAKVPEFPVADDGSTVGVLGQSGLPPCAPAGWAGPSLDTVNSPTGVPCGRPGRAFPISGGNSGPGAR